MSCTRHITLLVTLGLLYTNVASQDPVESRIAGVPNATIIGEIGRPLKLRCLAYGDPKPFRPVQWLRGRMGPVVPYTSSLYEARDKELQIKELNLETLGEYQCHAYNRFGRAVEWTIVVQAYRPEGFSENAYLIERSKDVVITTPTPAIETTTLPSPTSHQAYAFTQANEVDPDCFAYVSECASLRCVYGVQRVRVGGCERCACEVEVDCEPLRQECDTLRCNYGVQREVGSDGCTRCRCYDHPCASKVCGAGERCVASAYRDPLTQQPAYSADCRLRRLAPPVADQKTEPAVRATEGGSATLRCLFHGNPPPRITWRRGEITIDGDLGRYRLLTDGALEIVSLYRNDSGVYICVASNELGVTTQTVTLDVGDPVDSPAGIAGVPNATIIGEIGRPLNVHCLAYGYPKPYIQWYLGRIGPMVPYTSSLYEARDEVLQIKELNLETLGEYQCQAYNGLGRAAEWTIVVQAYRTEGYSENAYLIARPTDVAITPREPATDTTTPPPPTTHQVYVYTRPVRTWIEVKSEEVKAGSTLDVRCDVDGFPEPSAFWTKDGVPLEPSNRIVLTEARLIINNTRKTDSGTYKCAASNAYGAHASSVQITVQGIYIPKLCKDNPYCANCRLIVINKFCNHAYFTKFCCKSCVKAGQLDPNELEQKTTTHRPTRPYVFGRAKTQHTACY